jgi:hypothetical protein
MNNQAQTILNILHTLPSGAVNKANLKAQVQAAPEYSHHSPRSWQILTNEVWEIQRSNFVKLYKEPQGEAIAVFINQKQPSGALQCFSLTDGHSPATPEYLRTRCTRIAADDVRAQKLVKYLLNGYAANYHTDRPILL